MAPLPSRVQPGQKILASWGNSVVDCFESHFTAIPIDHPDNSITRAKLSGVFPIGTNDIADNSVTRSKLSGVFPIGTEDIADNSVTRAKLSGVFPIGTGDIADASVTRSKLSGVFPIGTNDIADNSVTRSKLSGVFPITGGDISSGAVSPPKLDSVNSPASNLYTTDDSATGKFRWAYPLPEEGRGKYDTTILLTVPGVEFVSVGTYTVASGRLFYEPCYVTSPITISALLLEVTTSATGNARVGIYTADKDWQPVSLVVDAGEQSTGTTGLKTYSVSLTLQPGRYLKAVIFSAGPTVRVLRGGSRYLGLGASLGASPFITHVYASTTYGALPTTPPKWNATVTGSSPFEHIVVMRVSDYL